MWVRPEWRSRHAQGGCWQTMAERVRLNTLEAVANRETFFFFKIKSYKCSNVMSKTRQERIKEKGSTARALDVSIFVIQYHPLFAHHTLHPCVLLVFMSELITVARSVVRGQSSISAMCFPPYWVARFLNVLITLYRLAAMPHLLHVLKKQCHYRFPELAFNLVCLNIHLNARKCSCEEYSH